MLSAVSARRLARYVWFSSPPVHLVRVKAPGALPPSAAVMGLSRPSHPSPHSIPGQARRSNESAVLEAFHVATDDRLCMTTTILSSTETDDDFLGSQRKREAVSEEAQVGRRNPRVARQPESADLRRVRKRCGRPEIWLMKWISGVAWVDLPCRSSTSSCIACACLPAVSERKVYA